jgi:glycine/D-amino acid oxidase-like deaminating enzyme
MAVRPKICKTIDPKTVGNFSPHPISEATLGPLVKISGAFEDIAVVEDVRNAVFVYSGTARRGGDSLFDPGPVQVHPPGKAAAGVMTDRGPIRANTVVICGGMWSRDLAAKTGVTRPRHAAGHSIP